MTFHAFHILSFPWPVVLVQIRIRIRIKFVILTLAVSISTGTAMFSNSYFDSVMCLTRRPNLEIGAYSLRKIQIAEVNIVL